jgi:hypothetical protein
MVSPTCFEPGDFILWERIVYAVWYVLYAPILVKHTIPDIQLSP